MSSVPAEAPRCDCCLNLAARRPWAEVVGVDSNTYHLTECTSCGLVAVDPPPTREQITEFYTRDYRGKVKSGIVEGRDATANRAAIEDARVRLDYVRRYAGSVGDRVLDVGCGHGFFLYAAQACGMQAVGVDVDEEAIAYARGVLGAEVVSAPIDDLSSAVEGSYDLVTFWQVLEHMVLPGSCVRDAADLLAPGGVVAGSMPNIRGIGARVRGLKWDLLVPPEHLSYFDERSCRMMLERAGLEPLFIGTIPLYASPYFKIGWRAATMRAAERANTRVGRKALLATHRSMTFVKRHLVYRPINAAIMWLHLGGNSVFFVARKPENGSTSLP